MLAVLLLATPVRSPSNEDCFRGYVNRDRAAHHVALLADDPRIDMIAERHSAWMAGDATIYHADSESPHYAQGDNLAAEYGTYAAGGENVGEGPDCKSIAEAFMASPAHEANNLDSAYTRLGVGVYQDGDTIYATLDFFTPLPPTRRRTSTGRCAP